MLKSQIRTGTINETKNLHGRLFQAVKVACLGDKAEEEVPRDLLPTDVVPADAEAATDSVEREDPEGGSDNKRGFLLGPVKPNFLFFTAAIIAYPMLWGFFASLFGAPGISMNEARRLNVRIDELTGEVRQLKEALQVAIELLKEKESSS